MPSRVEIMPSRVEIKRETVQVSSCRCPCGKTKPLNRWVVRSTDDDALYGYSSTWFGAWRMACQAVGWKVPT